MRFLFLILCGLLPCAHAFSAVWHVDPRTGDDAGAGDDAHPFRTLSHVAKIVNPGDTVLARAGVYYEHVKLERGGTAEAPITFKSAGGRDQTFLTGAHRALREKKLAWEPVAGTPGLWRVPLPEEPATLLCDELNLHRYPSLAELRTFTVENVALQKKPGPGPKHGFAWADGFLHVRLHPAGQDGDLDPNAHVFKASPARGTGFRGDEIDSRVRACFSTVAPGPAHVILEGFTFESPGFCGVWVRHGAVTVRDCRFLGCRTGVRGWDRPEKKPRNLSENVVVENCEFSEAPTYADAAEIIAEVASGPDEARAGMARFFWWHRKGGAYSSEIGLVTAAGRHWQIRNNFIHDVFDGLSSLSLGWSEDCVVSGNRFERIVDNAVEAENHAQRLQVRDNVVVDCFEPFSYQPLDREPWPAEILFERNRVSFTPAGAQLWSSEKLGWRPACVKIYAMPEQEEIPGGLVFRENRWSFPTGRILSLNQAALSLRGVRFEGNHVSARALGGSEKGAPATLVQFSGNHAAALSAEGLESLRTFTAQGGRLHDNPTALELNRVSEQR